MGAWSFIDPYLEWVLEHIGANKRRVRYAGRAASAKIPSELEAKAATSLIAISRHAAATFSLAVRVTTFWSFSLTVAISGG